MPSDSHEGEYFFSRTDLWRKEELPNNKLLIKPKHRLNLEVLFVGGVRCRRALGAHQPATYSRAAIWHTGASFDRTLFPRQSYTLLHGQILCHFEINLSSRFSTKWERSSFLFGEKQNPLTSAKKIHNIPPSPTFSLCLCTEIVVICQRYL